MPPELLIGCSGFNYSDWKNTFYPEKLAQRKWLEYYCTVFDTVELNVTFYRLPLAKTFEHWRDKTPDGFAFSLKGSRYITHLKRMLDVEEAVRTFFDMAMLLGEKMQVVLWQFSPGFKSDISNDSNKIKKYMKDGRDVFIYFNNDAHGYAPKNARELAGMLK